MNFKILISALFILFSFNSQGQNQFAFYKNGTELFTGSIKGKAAVLGKGVKIKRSKILNAANYFTSSTMPKDVLTAIPIADSMGFYAGLQYADGKKWSFLERKTDQEAYNLCLYNHETKTKTILFSQNNGPDARYAFRPFAWSVKGEILYLEALVFGSATENEGVWSYNIASKQFAKLSITSSYLTTPVISPDGKYFIYGAASGVKGPESQANRVYLFDIQKNKEILIQSDNNAFYAIVGWVDKISKKGDLLKAGEKDTSEVKKNSSSSVNQQVDFKLPWPSSEAFCVSRTGSLLPNMDFPATCAAATCGPHSGDHGYQAIDFSIPLQTNILAVAGGTVVFAWFNATGIQQLTGGYGNLVKVKHSDNTYTYYAHLNSIGVKVGDVVSQGCVLGKSGNTGHSSGPHLHFEWRDANEAKFNNDDYWPVFTEYGCTPNQNKRYTSQNTTQSCPGNFSLNCANAIPITCGQVYNGQTTGKQSSSNNATTGDFSNVSTNPYTTWNDPGPEDIYQITTTSTGDITATLSNYTTGLDLDVFILNGCSVTNNPGNVTVTSTSSTMTNAAPGTYYILVDGYASMYPPGQSSTSYNGHYGSYTLTVTCSACGVAPAAPAGLSAAITGNNQTHLTWSGSTAGMTGFELERATALGGPYTLLASTGTTKNFTDTTGISGTTYFYRVRSCCETNCSAYSDVVSMYACAYSAAPVGILAPTNHVCIGESVVLTVEGGVVGTGAQWTWRTNQCSSGAIIETEVESITITPTASGYYFVKPEGGLCGTPVGCASIYITVNPLPTVNLGANTITLNQGQQTVLNAAGPGLSYFWSTGATTSGITVNTAGTYVVTVTSASGCTATDAVVVSITTATNDPEDPYKISVSPNPTGSLVYITCQGSATSLAQLTDQLGRVVLEDRTTVPDGETRTLNLGPLPAGSYWVQLVGKGFARTVAVVKY